MKRRDLEQHLRDQGCFPLEPGAKHDSWINPVNDRQTAVPRHKEIPIGTVAAICRQLGVPKPRGR